MFKGRALLVIDRLHTDNPKEFHWDIEVCALTGVQDDHGCEVLENFSCMEYDSVPAPAAAYKMAIGDRIRVLVHYEMHYRHNEYYGDYDVEVYFVRERVLRRQPYTERRYRKNHYRYWKEQQ